MPVSDTERLLTLARHLRAAGAEQDWDKLVQLDRLVTSWAVQPPEGLPAAEAVRAAWQEVAAAHAAARTACQQALHEAGTRLRDLPRHNEAHAAYAWQEQFS